MVTVHSITVVWSKVNPVNELEVEDGSDAVPLPPRIAQYPVPVAGTVADK